jgi:hypothetical protein
MEAPDVILSCRICFANADSPLLDAARLGVLVMGGVTLCVLGAFARWFAKLARLSNQTGEDA